jgi:hypothetical protein
MATAHDSDIHAVLRSVGAEDFSDDGESGVVTVEGAFAAAIVAEIGMDSRARTRMGLTGHPVRISRMGGLEIWCNGFYLEGKGVRRVVLRATRDLAYCTQESSTLGISTRCKDVFEPRHEPARSLYLAFQTEASNRKERSVDEWMAAERNAVFREANHQAQMLGLRIPTMDEVISAERYAVGSVDYGATWAYRIVEVMQKGDDL